MSPQENNKEYYEVLELAPGAPFPEVRAAYQRLKDLYGGDSIVLSPLEDELSVEWKESVLDRIENAYEKLSELNRHGRTQPTLHSPRENASRVDADLRIRLDSFELFTGETLRQVRVLLDLEIHEVSLITKISKQHLKNIEGENFSALPEEVFLRGYLSTCARLYTLDVTKVVSDYLERFRAWKHGG